LGNKNIVLKNGVYAASLTPLDENLNIDHDKFQNHINWLLANGCDGVVFMGTTGEANSFSLNERIEALEKLIEAGIPANKLMVGTGCCAITDTIQLTKHACEINVGGILLLPPFFYKKITDEGIYSTIDLIINEVKLNNLRVYLYHIPQMSAVPFSLNLIKRLVDNFPDNIIGIKDSGGDWNNTNSVHKNIHGFKVYAGSETFLLDIMKIGGTGCISATGNITCALAAELYNKGINDKSENLQYQLNRFREVMEKFPMIPALKRVMAEITNERAWLRVRPPLVSLRKEKVAELLKNLKSINFPEEYIK